MALAQAHGPELADPSIDVRDLVASAQDQIFAGLWWWLTRPPLSPTQVLGQLEQTLEQIQRHTKLGLNKGSLQEADLKRMEYAVVGRLRSAVLGGIGAVGYFDAFARGLADTCDHPGPLADLLRGEGFEGDTTHAAPRRSGAMRIPSDSTYWSTPALAGPHPSDCDHLFARELVEGQLHPSMNWALRHIEEQPSGQSFLTSALKLHEKQKALRKWLIQSTDFRGNRAAPIEKLEGSIAGLPAENMALMHQLINAWIHAVFVELPLRLDSGGRALLRETIKTRGDFERSLHQNSAELVVKPASLTLEKLLLIMGDAPRTAHAVACGKLRADLIIQDGEPRLSASWRVPGMGDEWLANPAKCVAVPDLSLHDFSKRSRAIITVAKAFRARNGIELPILEYHPSFHSMVSLGWFLAIQQVRHLSERIHRLARWVDLDTGMEPVSEQALRAIVLPSVKIHRCPETPDLFEPRVSPERSPLLCPREFDGG